MRLYDYQQEIKTTTSMQRVASPDYFVSRVLGGFSVVFGITILAMFLPWQQTSSGWGRVLALAPGERPQIIAAPVDARIGKWFVVEGQRVNEGDLIVRLEDLDENILTRLESKLEAIRAKLNATQVLVDTSKINSDRTKGLFEKGLVSQREFETARQEHAKALIDLANTRRELASAEVEYARQVNQEIRAPMAGNIIGIMAGQGGAIVSAGERIAILVPDAQSRVAELYVDGIDLPLIEPGTRVRLQFEGWPAIQFSGAPDLAYGTFSGKVISVDPYDMDRGAFRVIAGEDPDMPDGKWPDPLQLRQGIRVKSWVLLNRVSVGYEIWRRMNGFPADRTPSGPDDIDPYSSKGKMDKKEKKDKKDDKSKMQFKTKKDTDEKKK